MLTASLPCNKFNLQTRIQWEEYERHKTHYCKFSILDYQLVYVAEVNVLMLFGFPGRPKPVKSD